MESTLLTANVRWCHRLSAEIMSQAKGRQIQPSYHRSQPLSHERKRYQAPPVVSNSQGKSLGTRQTGTRATGPSNYMHSVLENQITEHT